MEQALECRKAESELTNSQVMRSDEPKIRKV